MNIAELMASFREAPLNGDQSERLQAVRQAAAGFAAVIFQAMPESDWRSKAIDSVRLALMAAREGMAVEASPTGFDAMKDRQELVEAAARTLNKRQLGRLAALLGLPPEAVPEKKKA